MMIMFKLAIALYIGLFQFNYAEAGYKRVCYYTNWSQYRKGDGKFTPVDIPSGLCTHLIYAFAKLEGTEIKTIEANDEQLYKEFTGLKANTPNMKTMIAIGGWSAGSAPFSNMAATSSSRNSFIQSAIKFLRSHEFDGLDIDWEYPAARGGKAEDKANLALLLMEMREAFELESSDSGKDRLLISVAVAAGKGKVDSGYDVTTIGMNVDFINLMTYDFHGSWERQTGENSPLFARDSETGNSAQLNTAWAANYWASEGAPKDKIIVGMSFNGQTFTLASPSDSGVGAPSSGPGAAGKYTGQAGTLAYYETCKMLETGGSEHWNSEQHVPYYVNGDLWVGFDNVRSVTEKAKWITEQGFGGAMVWSLESDDFHQICSSSTRAYPLLSAINDALGSTTPSVVVDTTVVATPTATAATPTASPKTSSTMFASQTTQKRIIKTSTAQQTTATSVVTSATSPLQTSMASTAKQSIASSAVTSATSRLQTSMTSTAKPSTQEPVTTNVMTSRQPFTSTLKPSTQQLNNSTVQPVTSTAKHITQQPTMSTTKPSTQQQMLSTEKTITQNISTSSQSTPNPSTTKPYPSSTENPSTHNPTSTSRTSTMDSTASEGSTAAPTRAQKVPKHTASPRVSTTKNPHGHKTAPFSCNSLADGFYSDPTTCDGFYRCYSGIEFRFDCPPGTVYNAKISVCDWPFNAKCKLNN